VPVNPLRVSESLQLLLLLLQSVRHISIRVTVAVVINECRLNNGFVVVGSVVARLTVLVVMDHGRVTDVHGRRHRLLVLVVAAREYGGRQQPPYALFFCAVVAVR